MRNFNGFKKGIDLGGWFSQCDYSKEHLENFITESDIEKVASWGADHVRIPIDYNVLENDNEGYSDYGFSLVTAAVETCLKHGLNVVIDLHKTLGFSFDAGENEVGFFESEALQQRFFKLWEQIAKTYAKYTPNVAFELLNEITDKKFFEKWNEISAECVKRIRKYAPDTAILIGGYWNNSPEAVPDLAKPADDNIIYNFHCYDPLFFTHQGAYWIYDNPEFDVNKRMSFDESGAATEKFISLFTAAANHAKANGTILYCGEYGVINIASPEDTLKWYKEINGAFEALGINRCAWSYKKMDFGLSDEHMSGVIDELVNYI